MNCWLTGLPGNFPKLFFVLIRRVFCQTKTQNDNNQPKDCHFVDKKKERKLNLVELTAKL
jgi:hypothetical protein